jgi:hypothetical protein
MVPQTVDSTGREWLFSPPRIVSAIIPEPLLQAPTTVAPSNRKPTAI